MTCDIKSIKPSKGPGRPYVSDIRQIWYRADATMHINLTYEENKWEVLPQNMCLLNREMLPLYSEQLKINYAKFVHLQQIKVTIPREAHYFYDNLEHYGKTKQE